MFNSAIYLQQEIDNFIAGKITKEELSKRLHHIIDDVTIPDAVYTKTKS